MCNILIVDDEWAELECISYLIGKIGLDFSVYKAQNGQTALNYINDNRSVDILLTDIEMPLMDGIELSVRAKDVLPGLKTVIFSGDSEFEYARRAIDASVTGYILKPIKKDEFQSVMTKTYNQWVDENSRKKIGTHKDARVQTEEVPRKIIQRVINIVESKYQDEIGLDYIAGEVYLSPCYLSTLFKKEMGISLVKYIIQIRLTKAKELLIDTNIKIVDISKKVGFTYLPYFYTVFKSEFGMTPAEFREVGDVL